MAQTKKTLSYTRLKLKAYLKDYHPELLNDTEFIDARSNLALITYTNAISQGYNHIGATELENEVLYQGLHFSKYYTLKTILENEFSEEFPDPLPQKLAPILLGNKAIQAVFAKYNLSDEFDGSSDYDLLYTELTGTIALIVEHNKLPTAKHADTTSN